MIHTSYVSYTMLTRPWNWSCLLLPLALFGCAGGDIEDVGGEPSLAEFVRETPVRGDLYIEVTDVRGKPLQPERVEISVDGETTIETTCMDEQKGRCRVWIGDFEALEHVTAWATTCGHRFGAALPLGPDVDEGLPFEAAVTVVGVQGLCGSGQPVP